MVTQGSQSNGTFSVLSYLMILYSVYVLQPNETTHTQSKALGLYRLCKLQTVRMCFPIHNKPIRTWNNFQATVGE